MIRRIISKRQFDTLIEKGIIEMNANKEYIVTLRKEAATYYTLHTVGKIEEDDYKLTIIECTNQMYNMYIMEESHNVLVNDDFNPFEFSNGFYIPEWMFEDRQDDLVDMYKRYGKYKEE